MNWREVEDTFKIFFGKTELTFDILSGGVHRFLLDQLGMKISYLNNAVAICVIINGGKGAFYFVNDKGTGLQRQTPFNSIEDLKDELKTAFASSSSKDNATKKQSDNENALRLLAEITELFEKLTGVLKRNM